MSIMEKKTKENPHKGHRERVKTRYLTQGLDNFADYEALELLLFYAFPYIDTKQKAKELLKEFGSIHNLFDSDIYLLKERGNLKDHAAILLNLIPALARRYAISKWEKNIKLDSVKRAYVYVKDLFTCLAIEHFYLICLNGDFMHLNTVKISEGTVDETAVYKRAITTEAVKSNAVHVILAHNHPSGVIKPSNHDFTVTLEVKTALQSLDIMVLDHIIIAGEKYYSFNSHGYKDLSMYPL